MRPLIGAALAALTLALTPVAASTATAAPTPTLSAVGAGSTTADAGLRQTCTGPRVVCPSRLQFGLSVPRVLRRGANLTSLETAVGRRADLVGSYQDFTEPMYTRRLKQTIASGRRPVVTWEPFVSTKPLLNTRPLARIAAGRYDRYLRRSADQAKAVGKPFIIRFGHEMNGFWYPWGQPRPLHPQSIADPTNTPAAYVAAYRHVVTVFRQRGVRNVAWMWSPNLTDANPNVTLQSLYPGDAYVDVIGLSGYLEKPTDTFESRYRDTMTELAPIGPGKPVLIAETGAVVDPGRTTALPALMSAISAEPRVTGLIYFSQPDKTIDYRLEGHPDDELALRTALAQPRFTLTLTGGAAFATTPLLTGEPLVGDTVTAAFQWRGSPSTTAAGWVACPSAGTPVADCTRVGWGSELVLGPDLRGQYVRATLDVTSPVNTDETETSLGLVLNVPPAVDPAGVDMLGGNSVRLRFPSALPMTTHWVVGWDGGDRSYLPTSTTEKYFNSLVTGTEHTLTLGTCDCPSKGPETSVTFTLLARPAAPTYTTAPGAFTVTLPAPATGQTAWVAVVDGVEEVLDTATTTLTRTGLAAGQHSVGIRAVSGIARTNPTFVYPQVPAVH